MFLQGVSCLPAPGDTYHLNDCMVFADVKLTGIPMVVLVVLVVLLGVSMVLINTSTGCVARSWAGERNSSTLLEHLQCSGRQKSELNDLSL